MDKSCEVLCEQIASAMVKRDFDAVHALLAPWLGAGLGPPRIREMVDTAAEGLAHPPASWVISEGLSELDDLRVPDGLGPPSQGLSKEITRENFRGWLNIQFAPESSVHEEQNVCYDLWLIAVEHHGAMLAGYLEAAEPS